MHLLILRHAESHGNATGEYGTAQSDSLSPRGSQQALTIVTGLQRWNPERIIVSPLLRTLQTIAPYLSASGQRAEIWPEVAEACWQPERESPTTDWRGAPARLPDELAPHFTWRDGQAVRPVEPESFGMGLRRVLTARERLEGLAVRPHRVLLVTHGHFIRELLLLLLRPDPPAQFHHRNCGVTLLHFAQDWTLQFSDRPEP